ncbi:hypothetical protein PLEOSDRAFT_1101145 [Pleurotus ostreatus PC15]|uniref:Uncharacterized protein n=1 Tax=Pleurotus ostreatus (strain PC15) TaxID=1137138 RepID=A0A067NQB8_PLEO1|nr:hypothetical protein PLEOSDRAFT_1101145 [Pleurotus ostreatus PC15]
MGTTETMLSFVFMKSGRLIYTKATGNDDVVVSIDVHGAPVDNVDSRHVLNPLAATFCPYLARRPRFQSFVMYSSTRTNNVAVVTVR